MLFRSSPDEVFSSDASASGQATVRRAACSIVRHRERLIRHYEQRYPLNQADDRRNERPAENEVDHAPSDLPEVEFVQPETSKEDRKERRYQASAPGAGAGKSARWRALPDTAFWTDLGPGGNLSTAVETILGPLWLRDCHTRFNAPHRPGPANSPSSQPEDSRDDDDP